MPKVLQKPKKNVWSFGENIRAVTFVSWSVKNFDTSVVADCRKFLDLMEQLYFLTKYAYNIIKATKKFEDRQP